LIINYSPDFLYHSYLALKEKVTPNGLSGIVDTFSFRLKVDYFKWIISGINIIVGYLLLTNYDWIARKLSKKE